MPSACTKPDNKTFSEVENSSKQCISIVEKKVRNLEKRKGKLDTYRQKQNEGETLSRDQLDAVSRYDSVIQSLELARELQKMFQQVSTEVDKLLKKKARREKLENQAQETQRVRELLKLQSLLEDLGSESAQEDFKNGTNGALSLTEEQLNQLDELYKLINPTREEGKVYDEQMLASAEHITSLLDAKEKEVAGTTYKDLYQLVSSIYECGYFDKVHEGDAAEETTEAEVEGEEQESASVEAFSTPAEPETQPEAPQELAQQPVSLATLSLTSEQPETILSDSVPAAAAPATQTPDVSQSMLDSTYYSSVQQQQQQQQQQQHFQRQRPINEIVSSVQGSFNFLQDSEIDLESPHQVDPAVVAMATSTGYAQPMESSLSQSAYQGSSLMGSEDVSAVAPFSSQTTPDTLSSQNTDNGLEAAMAAAAAVGVTPDQPTVVSQPQYGADSAATQYATQQDSQATPPPSTVAYPEQSYSQKYHSSQNYAQSLAAGTSSHVSHSPASFGVESMGSMEGSVSLSTAGSASDVPQPIPLPNQTLPGQSLMAKYDSTEAAGGQQNKKEFTMNPNADPFQSMYEVGGMSQTSPHDPAGSQQSSSLPNTQDNKFGHETSPTLQGSQDYQGSGYNSGFGGRGNGRGGRGTGGGRGGRGNMTNGYNRGGNSNRGGGYSGGGRGGYQNGGRGGGRGGNNYQGYGSRNDYRQEGSYQSYSGAGNYASAMSGGQNSGYKSGSGAAASGGPRGASRGAMRGGAPRGGSGGGAVRGAGGPSNRGGGFGRPSSSGGMTQPQTA